MVHVLLDDRFAVLAFRLLVGVCHLPKRVHVDDPTRARCAASAHQRRRRYLRRERLDPISVLCEQQWRRVARRDDEVVVAPAKRLKQRREEPFGSSSEEGYVIAWLACFENRVRFARNDSPQWTERPTSPSERATASAESVLPSATSTSAIYAV